MHPNADNHNDAAMCLPAGRWCHDCHYPRLMALRSRLIGWLV